MNPDLGGTNNIQVVFILISLQTYFGPTWCCSLHHLDSQNFQGVRFSDNLFFKPKILILNWKQLKQWCGIRSYIHTDKKYGCMWPKLFHRFSAECTRKYLHWILYTIQIKCPRQHTGRSARLDIKEFKSVSPQNSPDCFVVILWHIISKQSIIKFLFTLSC